MTAAVSTGLDAVVLEVAVTGSAAGGTCSVGHLSPKAKREEVAMGAASEAAGRAMDMIEKP